MRILARLILSLFFILAGVSHFQHPHEFERIVPPALPAPLTLVYLSGIFEILGGLGILWEGTRAVAGWGLVALLIAVYPANIYMATSGVKIFGFPSQPWMAWARLPLQFVFIAAVIWSCDLSRG